MKAIRIQQNGNADVLSHDDVARPVPGPDDVLVRVEAAGVNYLDVYHRNGLYPVQMPFTLGQEGCGIIEETGANATWFTKGERVAWAQAIGSYAEYVNVPAARAVKVPDAISCDVAAAVMLQGMTAHYLAISTYPLKATDTCLIYAAAGGVGLLLTQIAKLRGAAVIGAVSSDAKAKLATGAGADHVIRYDHEDVAKRVREITNDRGVDVVYDAVGKSTWQASLDSLRPRGMMVSFGNASGPVPPFEPLELSRRGSLFLTRPTLVNYTNTRTELELRANDLFAWIMDGSLKVHIHKSHALSEAAHAHRALESRETVGKVILKP